MRCCVFHWCFYEIWSLVGLIRLGPIFRTEMNSNLRLEHFHCKTEFIKKITLLENHKLCPKIQFSENEQNIFVPKMNEFM